MKASPCTALVYVATTICILCSDHGVDGFGTLPAFSSFGKTTISKGSSALNMAPRRGRPKGPLRTFDVKPPMNEEIKFSEVRVTIPSERGINKDESLGIMSRAEAIAKAREMKNDLILINENGDPPVCKIMDYSKFRYNREKAAKEKKKNSKSTEIKEIKMSYKIDVHDYQVRKRNTERFIMQGNRVKCSVIFKGREIQHDDLGMDLLYRLQGDLEDVLNMENRPKREGRAVSCIMSPKPDVMKKINEKKRQEEKAKKKSKQEEKAKKATPKELAAMGGGAAAAAMEMDGSSDDDDDEDSDFDDEIEPMDDDFDDEDDDDEEDVEDMIKGDAVTDDLFA